VLFGGGSDDLAAFVNDQRARATGSDVDAENVNRSLLKGNTRSGSQVPQESDMLQHSPFAGFWGAGSGSQMATWKLVFQVLDKD
jgi:hypothetical protein